MRPSRQGVQLLSFVRCALFGCTIQSLRSNILSALAGDLLRAEQNREGSQYGELIRTNIKEGKIVPMEVTIKLLENAMNDAVKSKSGTPGWEDGKGRFLIDGFPRKMDQAEKFEEDVSRVFVMSGLYIDADRCGWDT